MNNCTTKFNELTGSFIDIPILFFKESNCQGDPIQIVYIDKDKTIIINKSHVIKSFIIPENVKTVLFKSDEKYIEFDKYLWGNFIDDTAMCLDMWKILTSQMESRDSFENLTHLTIETVGPRNELIASSCVGELDKPLLHYDYEKDTNECNAFLDAFCQNNDSYSNEICKSRKLITKQDIENYEKQNTAKTGNIYLIVYIIIGLFILFCILYNVLKYNTNHKLQKYKQNQTRHT